MTLVDLFYIHLDVFSDSVIVVRSLKGSKPDIITTWVNAMAMFRQNEVKWIYRENNMYFLYI